MSYRRTPFVQDEYYHCYTRGIDGRITFQDEQDYQRFQEYLYLCNDVGSFDRNNFLGISHSDVFVRPRQKPLVAIGFYSLMPNHFHIGIRELEEGGSSKFLQKLGTSYSMYFNSKYGRSGSLFIGPCRSKHISDDRYFKRVTQYIHLNAAELFEPQWKQGRIRNMRLLENKLRTYLYGSLRDYAGVARPESRVLDAATMAFIQEELPTLRAVLEDSREYYASLKYLKVDEKRKHAN